MFSDPPDVASARAKWILAARLQGETVDAELESFRRDFPTATGRLAGRHGMLAEVLTSLLKDSATTLPGIEPLTIRTFGASESRSGATSKRFE